MDAASAATTAGDISIPPITILKRRNSSSSSSIATTTTTPTTSSSSCSSDFELKTTCYTSLRDLLPPPAAHVHSPKPPSSAFHSYYEISIRNHLVKQAAWAYLQPMSTSPEAAGATVLHRLWTQLSGAVLHLITTAFDCLQIVTLVTIL